MKQERTILKEYPISMSELQRILQLKTKKELVDLLFKKGLIRYYKGSNFESFYPVLLPTKPNYKNVEDIEKYQTLDFCGIVTKVNNGLYGVYRTIEVFFNNKVFDYLK